MKTADQLWDLLRQAEQLPYGAAQIALVEEVLRHADTVGDPDLSFTTRIIATTAYVYGGEPVKAFPTFAWSVNDFDNNPGPHHGRFAHNLLWDFKTMVSSLTRFPEIPLARTNAVLDDMERRYREGGHSMQAVYKRRHLVARHLGRTDAEDEWFEKWQAAPRDELSDCAGCDPTSVLVYLASRGRYADAVALGEPVLAGELSCNEQPQNILTELMEPYIMTGRLTQAVDAHRLAYRRHRTRLADLGDIGWHVVFCARSGNEHRGLEILQRHIDWLDRAPSPASAMSFAAAGGLVLRRITELGHGDLLISRKTGASGDDRVDVPAAELAAELATMAVDIARRFDERNGTDAQSRWVADRLAAEPYGVDLPLSPTARAAAPAAPTTAPAATAAAAPEPVEIPDDLGPAELLFLARDHLRFDRLDAMRVALDAFDERFPDQTDPWLAGHRAVLRGHHLRSLLGRSDGTTAAEFAAIEAAWQEGADLLERAGELGEALPTRAQLAVDRASRAAWTPGSDGVGEADNPDGAIDANIEYQEKFGEPRKRANAWSMRSVAHFARQRYDEANEAGDRADAYAADSGDPRLSARHALTRASHRAAAGRSEEAAAAAREAWDFYREHGPAARLALAAVVFGQLTDDLEEQVQAFTVTLSDNVPGATLVARIGRGRALMRLGRAAEAIPDLVEAVALCTEQGVVPGDAFARQDLANAYKLVGRPVEAAEVAEEAVIGFAAAGLGEPADDTRYLLAGLYRDLGDNEEAVAGFRELLTRLTENPAGRAQLSEELGDLLFRIDRDAEAVEQFRVAGEALHEIGDLIGELRAVRRRLSAQHYADDVAGAEETIREIDELWEELPAELAEKPNAIWQRAMTGFDAAQMLMSRDRYAGAVAHLRGAPEKLRGVGATDDANRLECMLGEALLRSGEVAQAADLLTDLLARTPADWPLREAAEGMKAEAQGA